MHSARSAAADPTRLAQGLHLESLQAQALPLIEAEHVWHLRAAASQPRYTNVRAATHRKCMELTHIAGTALVDALGRVGIADPAEIHVARHDVEHGAQDDVHPDATNAERRA